MNVVTSGSAADEALAAMQQQVEQLQEELQYTHAHYHKMLEQLVGPEYTKDLGPVERPDGGAPTSGKHNSPMMAVLGSLRTTVVLGDSSQKGILGEENGGHKVHFWPRNCLHLGVNSCSCRLKAL